MLEMAVALEGECTCIAFQNVMAGIKRMTEKLDVEIRHTRKVHPWDDPFVESGHYMFFAQ